MATTPEPKTARKRRRRRRWTRLTSFELALMSIIVGGGVTLTLVLLIVIGHFGSA